MFDPLKVIAGLSHLPGVYRMINAAGEAIYVGKAGDLKKRVSSYFQKQSALSPRIQLMLGQVQAIETTVTRSEAEALLLENNLIKSLSPRYNILFRDDKSYPYLMLTGHGFPRLAFHRGGLDPRHHYFGPFPNAGAVRLSMQLLQKVFRLRTCADSVFENRSRPCLLHQIRRCTAPCVDRISAADYAEDVRNAELFLKGKDDEAIERLIARMNAAAGNLDYEQAAAYRDQIGALRKVREKQFVSSTAARDADIIACALEGEIACVNLVMIRGGHHLGDRNFYPRNAAGHEPSQIVEAFISQHYLNGNAPPVIVVNAAIAGDAFERLLSDHAGHKVRIVANPAGERRVWLEMAAKNAALGAQQQLGLHATQEVRLQALQQALGATEPIQRIECFDVSHTMGEATVASCVVYDQAAMQKAEYRRFNIAGIEPGDDYAAMREVLSRRYRRLVAGEGKLPDLVLIDGGKGQLGVAREVFTELGLSDVPLIGVAKGAERKPGLEQLIVPGRANPLQLAGEHPALHLIQQIRDEAHRFAIQGHRARRGKARTTSSLESIAGVGARRRQRLLAHFGGIKGLLSASVAELAQVDGISRALAARIYDELH
ncbi:MAG: excinuclease ABC subunit UvrC [Betaproteobacteria bacterium]|nr:excinuclease ABC subunit UvrC [Betaproteobacteria bacterium]